jgi:hypothetical protein
MSEGFEGYTDHGSLLYSMAGKNLHFIGMASLVSGGAQTARFTIQSTRYPLVLARMLVGETLCVYNVFNEGGTTWFIDVAGPSARGANLLCYGELTYEFPRGPFGLRTLTDNGEVSFDTTRNPLWLSEVHTQYGETMTVANMGVTHSRTYTAPALSVYAAAQSTPGVGASGGIYMLGITRVQGGHSYSWTTAFPGAEPRPPGATASRVNHAVFVIESLGVR